VQFPVSDTVLKVFAPNGKIRSERSLQRLTMKGTVMSEGFLGNQASFMLDIVVCALVVVVPTLLTSLYLVKVKKNFLLHRNLQLLLGVVLLIAVGAFEIDMHLIHKGWENIVARRHPEISAEQMGYIQNVLWVHLIFAITTPFFWVTTIVLALKRIPSPPAPCEHSGLHKKLGWISTIDITMTSVTGLFWYYVAFVS